MSEENNIDEAFKEGLSDFRMTPPKKSRRKILAYLLMGQLFSGYRKYFTMLAGVAVIGGGIWLLPTDDYDGGNQSEGRGAKAAMDSEDGHDLNTSRKDDHRDHGGEVDNDLEVTNLDFSDASNTEHEGALTIGEKEEGVHQKVSVQDSQEQDRTIARSSEDMNDLEASGKATTSSVSAESTAASETTNKTTAETTRTEEGVKKVSSSSAVASIQVGEGTQLDGQGGKQEDKQEDEQEKVSKTNQANQTATNINTNGDTNTSSSTSELEGEKNTIVESTADDEKFDKELDSNQIAAEPLTDVGPDTLEVMLTIPDSNITATAPADTVDIEKTDEKSSNKSMLTFSTALEFNAAFNEGMAVNEAYTLNNFHDIVGSVRMNTKYFFVESGVGYGQQNFNRFVTYSKDTLLWQTMTNTVIDSTLTGYDYVWGNDSAAIDSMNPTGTVIIDSTAVYDRDTTQTIDSTFTRSTVEKSGQRIYRISYITIPIRVGKRLNFGKSKLDLLGGLNIHINQGQKVLQEVPEEQPVLYGEVINEGYLSYMVGVAYGYELIKGFELFAKLRYMDHLSGSSEGRFGLVTGGLGLRYHFMDK